MPKWTYSAGENEGKSYQGSAMVDAKGQRIASGSQLKHVQKLARDRLNHARIVSYERKVPRYSGPAWAQQMYVERDVFVSLKVQLLPSKQEAEFSNVAEAVQGDAEPFEEVTMQYGLQESDYIKLHFLHSMAAQWRKMTDFEVKEIELEMKKLERQKQAEPLKSVSPSEEARRLGNAAFSVGDYERACKHYSRGIGMDPSNSLLYSNRALTHLKQQQHAQALRDCNAALQYDPGNVKALLRRARAHLSERSSRTAPAPPSHFQAALSDLQEVLRLEPHNKEALDGIADLQKCDELPL